MKNDNQQDSKLNAERTANSGAQGTTSSDAVTEEFPIVDETVIKAKTYSVDNTSQKSHNIFEKVRRKQDYSFKNKQKSDLTNETSDDQTTEEVKEKTETNKDTARPKKAKNGNRFYAILGGAAAACLVLALCACGVCLYALAQQHTPQSTTVPNASFQAQDNVSAGANSQSSPAQSETNEQTQAVCNHEFERVWHEEKVADSVDTKDIPAKMGTRTVNHTLCNVCLEQVDGHIEEHKQQTGHDAGYTPNVPCEETYEISPATTETVVTKGYTVKVSDSEECIHCHMLRAADRLVEDAD